MKRERVKELTHKCRVKLIYDEDTVGTIVSLGLDQSEVKLDNGTYRYIGNQNLVVTEG